MQNPYDPVDQTNLIIDGLDIGDVVGKIRKRDNTIDRLNSAVKHYYYGTGRGMGTTDTFHVFPPVPRVVHTLGVLDHQGRGFDLGEMNSSVRAI